MLRQIQFQKQKKIFIIVNFLLVVMALNLEFVQAEEFPLKDVSGYRYETAVRDLYEKKIIRGYSDSTFVPENAINRAEFVKILIQATQTNFNINNQNNLKNCFTDVKENLWYVPYICYAKEKKIISGYPDGTFKPSHTLNLAEALKMIVNVFGLQAKKEGENWFDKYVYAMGDEKYIPVTFTTPGQTVKRGEMVEMIWRVLEKKQDQAFVTSLKLLEKPCQKLVEKLPVNIDLQIVRETWLKWYNEERRKLGKKPYIYNSQLNRTAIIWSEVMANKGVADHKRSGQTAYYDYNLIQRWFTNLGLNFKNTEGVTYTENIGWGYYNCVKDDCTQDFLTSIRTTFNFFMSEKNKSYRPHYDSVINDSFREIGLGVVLKSGKYYLTVHYGTEIVSEPLEICE